MLVAQEKFDPGLFDQKSVMRTQHAQGMHEALTNVQPTFVLGEPDVRLASGRAICHAKPTDNAVSCNNRNAHANYRDMSLQEHLQV